MLFSSCSLIISEYCFHNTELCLIIFNRLSNLLLARTKLPQRSGCWFLQGNFTAYLPSFLETFYKNLSSTLSLSIIPSDSNDQHLCNSSLIDSSLLKATLQEMLHLSYFYVFLCKLVQIRYISTWFLMELSFVSYRFSYYNIPVMT